MAKSPPSFSSLKNEYSSLLSTSTVRDSWKSKFKLRANAIVKNRFKYEPLAEELGIPWDFIAVIHHLESGGNFNTHLHNGDPLQRRTKLVPAGRPVVGNPPFTWTESARDALKMKGFHLINDWSDERVCYELERYNGFGYRQYHPNTKSPYLWSGTTSYVSGKYVKDGVWDQNAVSLQLGAIPLLQSIRVLTESKGAQTVVGSKKVDTIRRTKTFLETVFGLFAGIVTLDNFGLAQTWIGNLKSLPLQWLAVLAFIATGWAIFRYLEKRIDKDISDGRYIPSGEGDLNVFDNPDIVAERSANRANRPYHDEAGGSEDERYGVESGDREGTPISSESSSAGDEQGNLSRNSE